MLAALTRGCRPHSLESVFSHHHRPERLSFLTRLWATPVYRLLDDPDGRPLRMRLRKTFLSAAFGTYLVLGSLCSESPGDSEHKRREKA